MPSVSGISKGSPSVMIPLHSLIRNDLIVSAHDISEGGLAVALAEMAIGGRLGVALSGLASVHPDATVALFSESLARFVLEVAPEHVGSVLARFPADDAVVIGTVTGPDSPEVLGVPMVDLLAAWQGHA